MKTKIITLLALSLLIAICLTVGVAFAEESDATLSSTSFDDTSVLADLNGAVIDGKLFSVDDYPLSADRFPRLLEFVEFSFSIKIEYQDRYGLYFYFYNPSGKEIADSELNQVEMAVKYDGSKPTDYAKLKLQVVSKSIDNVFYKLKLVENIAETYNRVSSTPACRRYDIVGIELMFVGEYNAVDYKVGGTWNYTGYAEKMSATSENESTLVSTSSPLTVVDLETNFTYYRTWKGVLAADQLTSCYFSVDETLAKEYDDLYSVQAQYYKYLSSPIFCIFDKYYFAESDLLIDYGKLHDELYSQLGKTMDGESGRSLFWLPFMDDYLCVYNNKHNFEYAQEIDKIAWLFDVSSQQNFTKSTTELLRYMQTYSADKDKSILGKYSSDLFANCYYDGSATNFVSGKKVIDLCNSGEDDFVMVGSSVKFDIWKALFGDKQWQEELTDIKPIVQVSYDDVKNMDNDTISTTYFVDSRDVDTFKEYLRNQKNKVTYLFRFSCDEYFTSYLGASYGAGGHSGTVGYMAQEPVFLDFDIISLGYRKDGVVTKIPVVCSPKDFIASVEAGQEIHDYAKMFSDFLVTFLTILCGVLLFVAIIAVIVWAFKVITKKNI